MQTILKIIMLLLVTMSFGTKCLADGAAEPTVKPTSRICFARPEIEKYKNQCEIDKANLKSTDEALQAALSDPVGLSFYQEKKFVGGLSVLTLILAVMVAGAK